MSRIAPVALCIGRALVRKIGLEGFPPAIESATTVRSPTSVQQLRRGTNSKVRSV